MIGGHKGLIKDVAVQKDWGILPRKSKCNRQFIFRVTSRDCKFLSIIHLYIKCHIKIPTKTIQKEPVFKAVQ